MSIKKIPSFILYAVSAIFMAYFVWAFSRSADIISEAIEIGQITMMGNLYEIFSFYMANTGQYFAFAMLLAGMGFLLHRGQNMAAEAQDATMEATKIQNNAELDEWFSENDKNKEE